MTTPTNLKVDDLNFDSIKENLKAFIQSQDQFTDVNFDASGISILIDLLAYNTYYNAAYLNFSSLESYLATAQTRNSVVNIARSLNYTPRSTISSRITGTIELTVTGTPSSVTLPAYTKFESNIDGTIYTFLTQEPYTIFRDLSGRYIQEDVQLIEGFFASERYVYNAADPDQRFIISNRNADTTTLIVRVQNSTFDSTVRIFNKVRNAVSLDGTSESYFIEEVEDGKFEVFFGDDVVGVKLTDGNIVFLEYITSSGALGNGVVAFNTTSGVANTLTVSFTADSSSAGGSERESIASIKFNAPKFYAAQNRAITAEDYAALIANEPNVGSVAVWGGEDNDPPAYGKVFIAVKPTVGDALTATEKRNLIDTVIKPKKVLTVTTEIVDPEFTYLVLAVSVKYDPRRTVQSLESLETIILNTIKKYGNEEINQFSKYFRYSQLTRLIDSSEKSILNNIISITLRKELDVQLNQAARYTLNFSNAINPATNGRPVNHPYGVGNQVTSNAFTYAGFANCFLEDNSGVIRIYRTSGLENIGVVQNAGTIDYNTGTIVLNDFAPTAFADGGVTLRVTVIPRNLDVLPLRGQILTILDNDITVDLEDDTKISLVKR
jgi:hypothetical protein